MLLKLGQGKSRFEMFQKHTILVGRSRRPEVKRDPDAHLGIP
jgi:hypothetical protein